MKALQEKINAYIFKWKLEAGLMFKIPLKYTAEDILEVVKVNRFITSVKIDNQYRISLGLSKRFLCKMYEIRQEINKEDYKLIHRKTA